VEVLLPDPVDSFWVMSTPSFEGKPFQVGDPGHGGPRTDSAPRRQGRAATGNRCGDGDLPRPRQDDAWRRGCRRADFGPALTDSAACLVAAEHGPDRQLERLLAGAGRIASVAKPILEVNPRHPLIVALAGLSADARAFKDDAVHLLFDQARVLDGERPADPRAFSDRLARVLGRGLGTV